ncbi:MAG TPA: GGDEF domain-containing protein [Anaerolineales bacterium]|nr:GGDEF domain-containing protein [Anaerolineales bacterium]
MFKWLFGNSLIDLGELEGDYRVYHLQNDIRQSTIALRVIAIGTLASLPVDALLLGDKHHVLALLAVLRMGFIVATLATILTIQRTKKVKVFDRMIIGWLTASIIFLNILNYMRPIQNNPFDIIFPLAIYILSPLNLSYTFLFALGYSTGVLFVNHVLRTSGDPATLSTFLVAQIIAHALGSGSAIEIQRHRKISYRAYIHEKDAREVAAYLSNIDPLTESLTRRHFFNIAGSEFLRYLRYRRPLSVLVIDADHFKAINDTYGHHAGDIVLRSMSLVMLEQKRAQDTLGRLGGEEFGLLLPETNLAQAKIVAERIQKAWENTPTNVDGELIRSTVSIGVAEATPEDKSFEDVLRRADRMLYKAKERGRNQVAAE